MRLWLTILFCIWASSCSGQDIDPGNMAVYPLYGNNETYGSGWNGDALAPEKDDIYNYLHQMDTNDDGDVDNFGSHASSHESGGSDTLSFDSLADGTTYKKFLATERTKLNGIESGATADQTAPEILTAIKTVDGVGSGLDADTVDGGEPGTVFTRNAADDMLDDDALPDVAAIKVYGDANWAGGGGDVLGPVTNTDGYIPLWSGTDSKTLANGIANNSINWNTAYGWGDWGTGVDKTFVDALGVDADTLDSHDSTYFEPGLGNPSVDGYVLNSTTAGARSWVAQGSGSGNVTGPAVNKDGYIPLWDGTNSTALKGGIVDNSYFWTSAYLESRQWDGGDISLSASTGRTSLELGSAATYDSTYFEPALGNPSTDGYVLSSTAAGVRSWAVPGSGGSLWTAEGTYYYPNNQTGADHPFRIKDTGVNYPSNPLFDHENYAYNLLAYSTTSLPPANKVVPALSIYTEGKGDNTNFRGVCALTLSARDEPTISSSQRGVLYGLRVGVEPRFERNNPIADDVAAVVIANDALGWGVSTTATATDGFYIGHNPGFGSSTKEFGHLFASDANANNLLCGTGSLHEAGIDLGYFNIWTDVAIRIPNTKHIVALNNAGTANINLIGIYSSDAVAVGSGAPDLQIGSGSSANDPIHIRVGGVNGVQVTRSADTDSAGKHLLVVP